MSSLPKSQQIAGRIATQVSAAAFTWAVFAASGFSQEVTIALPEGAFLRPANGVKHPEIELAWDAYRKAVDEATNTLLAALDEQRLAVRQEGDLAAAELLRGFADGLRDTGAIPETMAESKNKPLPQWQEAVNKSIRSATAGYTRAQNKLRKAYADVADALIKDVSIDESVPRALLDEWKTLPRRQGRPRVVREASEVPTDRRRQDALLEVTDGRFGNQEWAEWNRNLAYRVQNNGKDFHLHLDDLMPHAAVVAFGEKGVLFVHPRIEDKAAVLSFGRITTRTKGVLTLKVRNQPINPPQGLKGAVGSNILRVMRGDEKIKEWRSNTPLWQTVIVKFDHEVVQIEIDPAGDWNAEGCFLSYDLSFAE